MRTAQIPARAGHGPLGSKRLLRLAGDDRLVEQIRRGNEAAFEVAFERHSPAILSFCRHMLGSREEAEDAVQHAFTSAYNGLLRDERPITFKAWLFTIARNRCLSMLRARREQPTEERDLPTAGLEEQVERRAELRDLVVDLQGLPAEQRSALLLAEVGDLTHTEVAEILECEVHRVKALVFRARAGLIERRDARDTPCEEIRTQLANLRGGSLRRSELKHHLSSCEGCREFRAQIKRQRSMLALVLPVTPSLGFKASVLGAIGIGGGSAGGGAALGGLGAAVAGSGMGATVAKVAIVGALVGGGAVAGDAVVGGSESAPASDAPAAGAPSDKPDLGKARPSPGPVSRRPRPRPRPLAGRPGEGWLEEGRRRALQARQWAGRLRPGARQPGQGPRKASAPKRPTVPGAAWTGSRSSL